MTSLRNKFYEILRNVKSDAVPRPPRSENQNEFEEIYVENDENIYSSNEPEEIIIEPTEPNISDKKRKKKSFFSTKSEDFTKQKPKKNGKPNINNVNTQATGSVINIVNSNNVHWGNVYNNVPKRNNADTDPIDPDDDIPKTSLIKLVMEADTKPDISHLIFVSENLGKNWHNFFRKIGFLKGKIDTFELEHSKYGLTEVRFKLLEHWYKNDDDGSLGCLANLLWEHGERQVVKELADMYQHKK